MDLLFGSSQGPGQGIGRHARPAEGGDWIKGGTTGLVQCCPQPVRNLALETRRMENRCHYDEISLGFLRIHSVQNVQHPTTTLSDINDLLLETTRPFVEVRWGIAGVTRTCGRFAVVFSMSSFSCTLCPEALRTHVLHIR